MKNKQVSMTDVGDSYISGAIHIFFSLAPTLKDKYVFEELCKCLRLLTRQHLIEIWHDSLISPGGDVDEITQASLRKADIIVLLISADFLDSDQCIEVEMQYALSQHTAPVLPVIVRPVVVEDLPFERSRLLPSPEAAISERSDQESALREVAQVIRQTAIEKAKNRRISIPPKLLQLPTYALPYRHNPFFTNRKDILAELYRNFTSQQGASIRTQTLYGLEGIGKTMIAREYIRRHQREYQVVLWFDATSSELLSASVLSFIDQLGIPMQDGSDKQQRFTAIRQWLHTHDKWLVVLDNLEDFTCIHQLIPLYGNGHVLLITPTSATREQAISVTQMTVDEGALLLLRRTEIIPEQGTHIATSEINYRLAKEIANALQAYPLALDQAGAYIKETQLTLTSYLKCYRLQQWRAHLSGKRRWFAQDHFDIIRTTLTLSLKKIARIDPNALTLLRFFAFLHPTTLPYEMIIHGAPSLTDHLHTIASNRLLLEHSLATLQRFSLIHHHADSTTFYMHSIVQDILRKELTKKRQTQLAKQAICLMNTIFPEVLFETWAECERYLPQVQYCSTLIQDFHLLLEEGGLLLERVGFYFYQRGCYAEAQIYLTQALRLQEQLQDGDPLDMAQTLNSLGLLSQRQARYQDAKVLHERALALREHIPDHPHRAESLHNLAILYEQEGQYQQAELFYLRALSLDERNLGPDHLDTAKTLNNLALVYYLQGYYPKAETAYQRVLTIYERILPAHHPDLAYPLNGLGTLAEKRADENDAAELYQKALTIREQALGKEHSETAHTINKLAHIAELRGNYQQAADFYQQALAIAEKKLGPEHPDVALFLHNLAFLLSKQGKDQQAKSLYLRALNIYEQPSPKEYAAAIARTLNNLGQLYHKTKNKEQAELFLRQALTTRTLLPSATHPDTAQIMSNLADVLVDQRKYEEAESFYQQALSILRQFLNSTYLDSTQIREKYAGLLDLLQRNKEATQLRQHDSKQEEPPDTSSSSNY